MKPAKFVILWVRNTKITIITVKKFELSDFAVYLE